MTLPRRLLALAAGLTAGALLVGSAQTPANARIVDDRCAGRGPIPASSLAHGVSGLGCSLVGRVVYAGRVSVVVPPSGTSVGADGVGTQGEAAGLLVTNAGSRVRAYVGAAARGATAGHERASSPPACQDRTFHLEGHRWATSLRYHVNLAKAPARFNRTTLVRQIKAADTNMRKGRNTCGKPFLRTPVARYLGRTKLRPNIKSSPSAITCGAYNTDNVVAFGNLPGTLLGWTCYWWIGSGRMNAADIMMDNGRMLTTKLPAHCVNQWDFEGALTHEFGHAYGMAHTGSGHANLTMQHVLTPCSAYARTLGLGDWLGMRKMYGAR